MNRRHAILFSILSIFFASSAIAQDLPTAKPESVGLSSERLERIATVVQRDIDNKRIAGAVTLVVRHGQVAWFKAQGMQDREAAKPMQLDSIFRICSMTKPITSVAVMMLYEQGYFLLDDPISKFLPEFTNSKVLVKTAGGAGLNSTAADYARFCQMMLEGGKLGNARLLSRKTVELMTHDQLGKISADQSFGLGFGIVGDKKPLGELGTLGEFNWGGFFYTGFSIDPKEQMIVVFMGQLHPTGDLELDRQVHELAYQSIVD